MIQEEHYVNFLIEHDITQSQFLLLFLVYKDRKDLVIKYKKRFPSTDNSMIGEYLTTDLKNKGFLIENENKELSLSNKFKNIFIDKHIAANEIFNIYPSFYNKGEVDIPLITMDRNIFANIYEEAIMGSLEEHKQVKLDILYGMKNSMLNISIEKFVKSKYWLILRKKRITIVE